MLDEVYNELKTVAKFDLKNTLANLCVDVWSNISNDPLVEMSLQHDTKVFRVKSVDMSG